MQTQLDAHTTVGSNRQSSYVPLALRKQNLILSAIAMLSDQEITLMNREDLLDALRMAQSASPRSQERNLDDMEVTELRRVLAIVRENFREQINRRSTPKIWSPEFN